MKTGFQGTARPTEAGGVRAGARAVVAAAVAALAMTAGAVIAPYAKFGDGMLSKTKPTGWIRTFCERQRTGLTGHPEALSYPYDTCLWNGEIARMGQHGCGWWRYEQTAYYTDGLLKLGYALGDGELIAKGEAGVEYTLAHATPDGFLGNPCLWDGKNHQLDGDFIMWPMAVFFRVMKAKYEAKTDPRIPAALTKYYLKYDAATIARYRNLVSVEGMLWCYSHNGDKRLVELAEKVWNSLGGSGGGGYDRIRPETCLDDAPLYMHGVSYCELMKVPMLLAAYTGKREYLDQAVGIERKLVRDHMLADGCPSSVEQTRGNSVHWGHETCDIADFSWSVGYALETTGDARYADEIERCVFNAGPGAVTKDFKALQYFSNPNQFIATGRSNHNPFFYGSTWMQYRPTHETECCAGAVHRILPNYVSRMWLTDRAGDPVAALYGPSEVDYGYAKIREETEYPFDGRLKFVFSLPKERAFAFNYRVPVWCAGAKATVNGEPVAASEIPAAGAFGAIRRTFRDGDVVTLEFPMEVRFERLAPRRSVIKDLISALTLVFDGPERSQGTVVARGPLVFSYPIETKVTADDRVYANMNGKQSANPDFACLDMRPAGPFNFALAAHEAKVARNGAAGYPFDPATAPVTIEVPARRIDWKLAEDRYTPDLPKVVKCEGDGTETLRLVPYGATCLRLTVFPDLVPESRPCGASR